MRSGYRWYHSSNSQSFHARMHASPSSRSGMREEHAAAEPGDLRREVHRRPHAVDVHVAHAGVDVVAAGAHLVEAERLELHRSPAAGRRPRSSRPGCSARPRTPRPGGPCASRRSCGARSWSAAGSRPSNVCGGSTTWSSTEITVNFTSRGAGSGRNNSSAAVIGGDGAAGSTTPPGRACTASSTGASGAK